MESHSTINVESVAAAAAEEWKKYQSDGQVFLTLNIL